MNDKHRGGTCLENYSHIFAEATGAALSAAASCAPRPMMVVGDKGAYYDPDGAVGYAYVGIDGRSGFARWIKKNGLGDRVYGGHGLSIYADIKSSSIARRIAWCNAFSRILAGYGIDSWVVSHLD